jgi:galactoside O-acetyltransferase
MPWLSREQIERLGLRRVGDDVRISDRCSFYGAEHVTIGDHVRIDDFVVITADEPVVIGSWSHLSAHVFVGGVCGVEMADFVCLSQGAAVFTCSDDFSGQHLFGATVPEEYRNVKKGKVIFDTMSGVGAHGVVLPGVHFPIGSVIGALSLANRSLEPWTLYSGVPARRVRRTSTRCAELKEQLLRSERERVLA